MASNSKIPPPPKPDSALTPQQNAIVRAAARLFRERGYERTTTRELGKALGLQSGSLFHHFDSKDEILAKVMEQSMTIMSDLVDVALTGAKTPREKLEAVFRAYLTAMLSEEFRDNMTVTLLEFRSLSPELAQRVNQVRNILDKRLQAVLNEAVPAGRNSASNRLKAQFVFGALTWPMQWYNPNGALSLDELVSFFTELAVATYSFDAQLKLNRKKKTRSP